MIEVTDQKPPATLHRGELVVAVVTCAIFLTLSHPFAVVVAVNGLFCHLCNAFPQVPSTVRSAFVFYDVTCNVFICAIVNAFACSQPVAVICTVLIGSVCATSWVVRANWPSPELHFTLVTIPGFLALWNFTNRC